MLVYFEIDKSTCILGAKFIKRIIGSNALIEGAAVMIDYEGQEYQADRLQ
jgi:hemin uptake protein HemP